MRNTLVVFAMIALSAMACSMLPSRTDTTTRPVVVFAAASMTNVIGDLRDAFEHRHPDAHIVTNLAGSSTLRLQLEHGAPADLFISADLQQIQKARMAGLLEGEPRRVTANRLSLAVRSGGPVNQLVDLAEPGIRLVIAQPQVPAGTYTQELFASLSKDLTYGALWVEAVLENVVSLEPNVRQVLAKLELGEADAAFVYSTDAAIATGGVFEVLIPKEHQEQVVYWATLLKRSDNPVSGHALLEFLLTSVAQKVFDRHGFVGASP